MWEKKMENINEKSYKKNFFYECKLHNYLYMSICVNDGLPWIISWSQRKSEFRNHRYSFDIQERYHNGMQAINFWSWGNKTERLDLWMDRFKFEEKKNQSGRVLERQRTWSMEKQNWFFRKNPKTFLTKNFW